MMKFSHLLLLIVFLSLRFPVLAQNDLLDLLEEVEEKPDNELIEATFKGTRLINGHSIETRDKGTLEFIISHRFGTINTGAYELWGLDQSNIRLALEYAASDRLMIGLGRSSFQKTYDGFVKYQLFRQQSGKNNIPFTMTLLSSMTIETLRRFDFEPTFTQKLAFAHQLLIARKFNSKLSLQVSPTIVQYNLIEANENRNFISAVGIGGRYKLTQRLTINAEYYPQLFSKSDLFRDAFAVGVDIETGGHVFQLQFTNATAMIETAFVGETSNNFFQGDVHFGFNIVRAFQLH
jgi:hypothetical protein